METFYFIKNTNNVNTSKVEPFKACDFEKTVSITKLLSY